MNKSRKVWQQGITMLELVVVVALIGVLTLIASTRILHAKEEGFVSAAQHDAQTLRKALALYAADYDCYPEVIDSIIELQRRLQDPLGYPYVDFPDDDTFSWISYVLEGEDYYVLLVEAHDSARTQLKITPETVAISR